MLREMPNWKLLAIRVDRERLDLRGHHLDRVHASDRRNRSARPCVLLAPSSAWPSRAPGGALPRRHGWLWRTSMEEWQGYYYQFNSVQVRVYEHDGETWLVATRRDQVPRACRRIPEGVLEERSGECGPIAETGLIGFTPVGVEKFFAEHPGPETGKLLLWMRREVLRNRGAGASGAAGECRRSGERRARSCGLRRKCSSVRFTIAKASWSQGISSSVTSFTSRLSMPGDTSRSSEACAKHHVDLADVRDRVDGVEVLDLDSARWLPRALRAPHLRARTRCSP